MVVAVHVLHRDSAPHADHKRFDLALVVAAGDAEVTVLSPVLSPGVCSNLTKKEENVTLYQLYIQIETLKEVSV